MLHMRSIYVCGIMQYQMIWVIQKINKQMNKNKKQELPFEGRRN